jgi:Mg/Co/Ni transporter MgtE
MDPISAVVLAALVAGLSAGITDVGRKAIGDGYEGLKRIIAAKYGEQGQLAQAINSLEERPESAGRQATMQEEVAEAQADHDAEVLAAVRNLEQTLSAYADERIQRMLNSEGGEQTMRGRGGRQEQQMSDSQRGKQTME